MRYVFTLLFLLLFIVKVNAQNISNEGTEFWLCFPAHSPAGPTNNPDLANLSVFITSKSNTSGVVSCGTYSENFNVIANTVTEVIVPRNVSYIFSGTGIYNNQGIKVLIESAQYWVIAYCATVTGLSAVTKEIVFVGSEV